MRPVEDEEASVEADANEGNYEVESVVGKREVAGGGLEYQIHWRGYSEEDRTWEPIAVSPPCAAGLVLPALCSRVRAVCAQHLANASKEVEAYEARNSKTREVDVEAAAQLAKTKAKAAKARAAAAARAAEAAEEAAAAAAAAAARGKKGSAGGAAMQERWKELVVRCARALNRSEKNLAVYVTKGELSLQLESLGEQNSAKVLRIADKRSRTEADRREVTRLLTAAVAAVGSGHNGAKAALNAVAKALGDADGKKAARSAPAAAKEASQSQKGGDEEEEKEDEWSVLWKRLLAAGWRREDGKRVGVDEYYIPPGGARPSSPAAFAFSF